jgi:hypothetical protein
VVVEFFRGISNLSHGHSTEVWGRLWGLRVAPLASGSSGPRGQQLPWGTRCHRAYHARVWSIRPKFKLRHYRKRTSDLRVLMSTRPSALRHVGGEKSPALRRAGLRLGSRPSRRSSVAKQFRARGLVPERKAPPKRGQVYCGRKVFGLPQMANFRRRRAVPPAASDCHQSVAAEQQMSAVSSTSCMARSAGRKKHH